MYTALHSIIVLIWHYIWKISVGFWQWKVNIMKTRFQLIEHEVNEIDKHAKWKQEGTKRKDINAKCGINVLEVLCFSDLSLELKVPKSEFRLYII